MTEVQRILNALSALRTPPQPEDYELHHMIAGALEQAGIEYIHEFRLMPGRRIDFVCGRIGIEVKKGRPDAVLLQKQLTKYLQGDALEAVIVVMQRPCRLPESINNKPVYTLALNRLWGVALP